MNEMTLVDFLLARIAEDEESLVCYTRPNDEEPDRGRVLGECAAKRAIVERLERAFAENRKSPPGFDAGEILGLVYALGAIALPYADHPDYRDEWKP